MDCHRCTHQLLGCYQKRSIRISDVDGSKIHYMECVGNEFKSMYISDVNSHRPIELPLDIPGLSEI